VKISDPVASVVPALLLSWIIAVILPIDNSRAEDNCAGAPGAATPDGQHWYYHIDRATHRKCWYLHTTVPLPNHAAAETPSAPSESALPVATPQSRSPATPQGTTYVPQRAPDTSNAPSEAVSTQPESHITVLTVKTVTTPFVSTTPAPQTAIPEQPGELPTRQIALGNASGPIDADTKPTAAAAPEPSPAGAESAHDTMAPTSARGTVRTQSAHLFLLLALGLGIAAALIALAGKMTGLKRVRLSNHPDDAWRSYRAALRRADETFVHEDDAPFLAPQEVHESADVGADEWIEQSPPAQADCPPARPRDGESGRSEEPAPTLEDIELVLRILRQARQSITRT